VQAEANGLNVRWWDFVFYMLFGLVVTSFVGGVLVGIPIQPSSNEYNFMSRLARADNYHKKRG